MKAEKQFGRCLLCGRVLKKEESEIRGYGDICYNKLHSKSSKRLFSINPSKILKQPKSTKSIYSIPGSKADNFSRIYNGEMR